MVYSASAAAAGKFVVDAQRYAVAKALAFLRLAESLERHNTNILLKNRA